MEGDGLFIKFVFQSKYFRYGFFGFLIAAALFYIWDKSLFEYRLRSQPIAVVLERIIKASPDTTKIYAGS